MCELFGLTSKEKVRSGGLLKEFFSHAADNPHGWGAAVFESGRASVLKQPESAAASSEAEEFAEAGRDTDLLVAHIRFATKGAVSPENTHPFVMADRSGTEWVLAHNGTIFDSKDLSQYVHRQAGETDSERILMYLIDSLNGRISGGRPLTESERISVVEAVIREITPENKVNLILTDGDRLYAHMNYRGSMNVLERGGATVISSKPLQAGLSDTGDEIQADEAPDGMDSVPGWEELPLNTLMVYEKGRLIYRGVPHENEYFEDEEKTRMLFLDYANM